MNNTRYNIILLGSSIRVHARNLTPVHARNMKQLLSKRYPDYQFRAVPSDAWNQIVSYLEKL